MLHPIYLLYLLLSPLIYLLLLLSIPFNKKIRSHFFEQKKEFKKIQSQKIENSIIIHAASAGEFEQVKPILRVKNNSNNVIQTFFSPTIFNKEKKSNLFTLCCYHPFDFPWSAFYFFYKLKPKKYIINRHDIWPHHIVIAKLLKINIIYINANLKNDSSRTKLLFKNFHKWLFKKIDIIIVPSKDIQNRFNNFFNINTTQVLQDTRYFQIQYRINKKLFPMPQWIKNNNIVILGSIDVKDWEIIKESLSFVKSEKLRLIIVPHEIDKYFINKMIEDLKEHHFIIKRLSDIKNEESFDAIIYDKVGDLLDLYKYGNLAYVGCGFSHGVHNVLEPALQGCFVSYGPNISLLDEAIQLDNSQLGKKINNLNDFLNFLRTNNKLDFLTQNKSRVNELFKVDHADFEKMVNIIYEK